MKKSYLFIAFLIIGIVSFIVVKNYVFSGHDDLSKATPDFTLKSADFYKEYSENEVASNKKFVNKTIEVQGVISETSNLGKSKIIFLSVDNAMAMGSVSCSLADTEKSKLAAYEKGKPITIRGSCAGYLSDIQLVR